MSDVMMMIPIVKKAIEHLKTKDILSDVMLYLIILEPLVHCKLSSLFDLLVCDVCVQPASSSNPSITRVDSSS